MGAWILILVLSAFAAAALWFGVVGWNVHGEVEMSGHGYAAMTLGILFSLIVGIGLMWLVFYSSRKGYDEPSRRSTANDNTRPDDRVSDKTDRDRGV